MLQAVARRLCGRHNLPLLLALPLLGVAILELPLTLPQDVYRIQVSFDITQSMNVEDAGRDGEASRLDLAKAAAKTLLLGLPCGSRVGWSVFTGHRVTMLVTPLEICAHHDGLLASLAGIDGRMRWVESSNVGRGLFQSLRTAQQAGDGIAVVFISDGHEAPPLRRGSSGMPTTHSLDARGLVAGVGGDNPAPIPKIDAAGRIIGYWQAAEVIQQAEVPTAQGGEHLSHLHEAHLQWLARQAKLSYARLDSTRALVDAVREARLDVSASVGIDLHWVAALLALALLCFRFLPSR